MVADVTILDEGTVVLFQLNTDAAKEFVAESVELASWQWICDRGFAVDHRCAGNLIAGFEDCGLTVE